MDNLAIIPALPLIGSVLAFITGKFNKTLAAWIATAAAFCSFFFTVKFVSDLDVAKVSYFFDWIVVGDFSVDFSLTLDRLSAVMCLVITGIGSLIHLYSISYMEEDPSKHRFFSYLNLFLFSMLILVLGSNLAVMFIGWEGVGLCSYLLISFWYKNMNYSLAGQKAFVVNRIGDAGVLIAIFLLIKHFNTLDFALLNDMIPSSGLSLGILGLIALGLFVGATGKSAQIPLFVWLPDAMAGPTPVSALIHAATMVTAGVYMMARMHNLYDQVPEVMIVVAVIAVLTAFVAATIAIVQNDIKKVLAYSTVSQLGFMFMACACGAYWIAIFHVVTHAFFKACLFLGAGSVIHGCHHEQDMRHMGGLKKLMPITFFTYALSTLAIAGIYPLAGYYSKHAIIDAIAHVENPFLLGLAPVIGILANLTAFITAFYMTRSLVMTFFGSYRGHAHPHESNWKMYLPLIILAGLACFGGIYLSHALPEYLKDIFHLETEHHDAGILVGILHSWIGLLGIALGFFIYNVKPAIAKRTSEVMPGYFKLFTNKYYIDEIYQACIVSPLRSIGALFATLIDQGIIDATVNGFAQLADISGEVLRSPQTGQVRHYAFYLFFASFCLLLFCVLI